MIRYFVALSVFVCTLSAQHNVAPDHMYHHVYAIVPLVGSGTQDDPKRPMLVPSPAEQAAVQPDDRSGLLSYLMQLSDDGKFALVDMVFQSPVSYSQFLARAIAKVPNAAQVATGQVKEDGSDLLALTANTLALKGAIEAAVPGVKLFERGKATETEILSAFRALKANFQISPTTSTAQGVAQ